MSGLPAVRPDVFFLVNFGLDLALLWFAARAARVRYRAWRLWVAALLGAALAVLPVLLPDVPAAAPASPSAGPAPKAGWLFSGAALLAGSAALAWLLVWPGPWAQFAAVLGFFWTGLILSGGLLFLLAERYPALFAAPPAALVAGGAGVALAGAQLLWQAYRERAEVDDGLYELEVRVDGRREVVEGLVDSGNLLRTPVGRMPVAVVEGGRLRSLLPPAVLEAASSGPMGLDGLPAEWQSRCQLVPFAAVGRSDGWLLVIRPDGLSVRPRGRGDWVQVEGRVGLAAGPLDPEGRYAALLPAAMVAAARRAHGRARGRPVEAQSGERGEGRPDVHVR
ncbi:sigma-E processing peptidase SpoIIGA [Symbiobacterium thermophilum]|uniref:sigma-E processing peptidase SpoIIGA n=1 Tax=Symbiobacterium thermophilum TaxID=2734 RepID=UPI0035C74E9A